MPEIKITIDHQGKAFLSVTAPDLEELQDTLSKALSLRDRLIQALAKGEDREERQTPVPVPVSISPSVPASVPAHFCPEHNTPFKLYSFGYAHPPLHKNGKWCKEQKEK